MASEARLLRWLRRGWWDCPWPMVTKSSQFPHCNSHQPILDGLGHPTRQHGSEQQKAGEAAIEYDPLSQQTSAKWELHGDVIDAE
jgi:hypothetical protein